MKNFLLKLWQRWWFLLIVGLTITGICINIYVLRQAKPQESPTIAQSQPVFSTNPIQPKVAEFFPSKSAQISSNQESTRSSLFGHFSYQEGDLSKMILVGSYGEGEYQRFERLMPAAGFALMRLVYAARDEGVWIVPVSCFRNLKDQQKLFVAQVQRRGSQEAAAKSSAPPGFSEHHTGYALDLTDGHSPQIDISLDFAETAAFKWMQLHAREFGFELSFPKNNSQGINYEPWHWRFIGTPEASEIFAANLN